MARSRASLAARSGLRVVCAYLFLYSFPFPLSLVPYTEIVGGWWDGFWTELVLAVARGPGEAARASPR